MNLKNSDTETMLFYICDKIDKYLMEEGIDVNSRFFLDFLNKVVMIQYLIILSLKLLKML